MQEITLFEPAKLSAVLKQNQGLSERAVEALSNQLTTAKAVNLTGVDVLALDALDNTLVTSLQKADSALEIMDGDRKPYTQKMDEIKKLFTTAENSVKDLRDGLKGIRNSIAQEKARRIKVADEEKATRLKIEQGTITLRTSIVSRYETALGEAVQAISDRIWKAFYAQSTETMAEWVQKFEMAQLPFTLPSIVVPFHPQINVMPISNEVSAAIAPQLAKDWAGRIDALKANIIELVPSRLAELQHIATDSSAQAEADERIKKEENERANQAKKEAEEKQQALQTQAEADKLNASFEVASEAGPAIQMAAGTSVKLKYKPTSHAGHVAIIQAWVTKDMPLMTLEDLITKLSFMRTACDKRLNSGERIEAQGLEVVEDYSTRSASRKEKAA